MHLLHRSLKLATDHSPFRVIDGEHYPEIAAGSPRLSQRYWSLAFV
jgi:hypothetical protein